MKYRPSQLLLLLRRLVRSIENRGLFGTVGNFFARIFRSVHKNGFSGMLKRAVRQARAPVPQNDLMPHRPHPFDLLHGTDTGGYISGAAFSAVSLSSFYTTAYLGISPTALTQALSKLQIRYEDFAFVDLGCGKGRALIVAAEFPFRLLLGVEIANDLCDTARANVGVFPDLVNRITIINQDATELVFPDGPLLIFLFHPFLAPVLRRVLQNLKRQLSRSPRPVYLLYAFNPRFTDVMSSFPFLRELSETVYPFSADEAAFDPFERTEESFTLYSADVVGGV